VRGVEMLVPVRDPDFWRARAADLSYLLYVLTRDSFRFEFVPREMPAAIERTGVHPFAADSVCLVSGGVDSLAGAMMLLKTGRQPLLVCHQSGNPTLQMAQAHVVQRLMASVPGQSALAGVRLHANGSQAGLPPAEDREPSQRSRAFLFMSLALAAAGALGVPDVYICENGILTIALPLSSARIGGLSTRSTHPKVIVLMNRLAAHCGLVCNLLNPFIYQTKAELIRDVLRPAMPPFDIQKTVSCWAAGRASRQCGGCVACLVRRLAMLAAGLPDEAYEADLLGAPDAYRGTDAHANLVDLLSLCSAYATQSDAALLAMSPELLDCVTSGVSIPETLAMYRRFAAEVQQVVQEHFLAAAKLMA
jgi:7-cyano-7-deazaguanine synthase in queuosine biosynthesis